MNTIKNLVTLAIRSEASKGGYNESFAANHHGDERSNEQFRSLMEISESIYHHWTTRKNYTANDTTMRSAVAMAVDVRLAKFILADPDCYRWYDEAAIQDMRNNVKIGQELASEMKAAMQQESRQRDVSDGIVASRSSAILSKTSKMQVRKRKCPAEGHLNVSYHEAVEEEEVVPVKTKITHDRKTTNKNYRKQKPYSEDSLLETPAQPPIIENRLLSEPEPESTKPPINNLTVEEYQSVKIADVAVTVRDGVSAWENIEPDTVPSECPIAVIPHLSGIEEHSTLFATSPKAMMAKVMAGVVLEEDDMCFDDISINTTYNKLEMLYIAKDDEEAKLIIETIETIWKEALDAKVTTNPISTAFLLLTILNDHFDFDWVKAIFTALNNRLTKRVKTILTYYEGQTYTLTDFYTQWEAIYSKMSGSYTRAATDEAMNDYHHAIVCDVLNIVNLHDINEGVKEDIAEALCLMHPDEQESMDRLIFRMTTNAVFRTTRYSSEILDTPLRYLNTIGKEHGDIYVEIDNYFKKLKYDMENYGDFVMITADGISYEVIKAKENEGNYIIEKYIIKYMG